MRILIVSMSLATLSCFFFFFNDPATTEIYTLSLHDALPIFPFQRWRWELWHGSQLIAAGWRLRPVDRKSTRLNSSHMSISYAVFCLKKKKKNNKSRVMNTAQKDHSAKYILPRISNLGSSAVL